MTLQKSGKSRLKSLTWDRQSWGRNWGFKTIVKSPLTLLQRSSSWSLAWSLFIQTSLPRNSNSPTRSTLLCQSSSLTNSFTRWLSTNKQIRTTRSSRSTGHLRGHSARSNSRRKSFSRHQLRATKSSSQKRSSNKKVKTSSAKWLIKNLRQWSKISRRTSRQTQALLQSCNSGKISVWKWDKS